LCHTIAIDKELNFFSYANNIVKHFILFNEYNVLFNERNVPFYFMSYDFRKHLTNFSSFFR